MLHAILDVFRCSWSSSTVWAVGLAWLVAATLHGREPPVGNERRHALLVGVSHYPSLGSHYQLQGPENDVVLMRQLLMSKFSFSSDSIRTLSETAGQTDTSLLPTRNNIEREFLHLAEIAKPGDEIVIFMAGHGSQQPEQPAGEPEPDGLDEIFLPRDVQKWQGGASVPNAIVDSEIAVWLTAIQARQAHVWIILDCCHAGDMTRGSGQRQRSVPPGDNAGLAIPAEVIEASRHAAASRTSRVNIERASGSLSPSPLKFANLQGLAIFYACQSHEKAIERKFPTLVEGTTYGLLTYCLNSVLSKSEGPLSYRELGRRIHLAYLAADIAGGQTPIVEGGDLDRAVLGDQTFSRSVMTVILEPDSGDLMVDAGRLHGITPGSVLAVYPPPGETGAREEDKVLGYVQAGEVDIASTRVTPWEFDSAARKSPQVLAGGRCEVVQLHYGDFHLRVFVDDTTLDGQPVPIGEHAQVQTIIQNLAAEADSLVAPTNSPATAQWLIRWQAPGVALVPIRDQSQTALLEPGDTFGPFPIDNRLPDALRSSLRKIARAENLLRLAADTDAQALGHRGLHSLNLDIEAQVERQGKRQPPTTPARVQPGDRIEYRVENTGLNALDVTVLYVDRKMGITALFPDQNRDNRLQPGESRLLRPARFTSRPLGRGYFVFIALEARGQPVSFVGITQSTIQAYRQVGRDRSPLNALLENALFGAGSTRSVRASEVAKYKFELIPVDVLARHDDPDAASNIERLLP